MDEKAPGRTARKRQMILEAASELFLRQGFPGTSMDEVAARAGVSKQTVYKQFASKEALFLGIVHSMTNAGSDRVQTEMRDPVDADQLAAELHGHAERLMTIALAPHLLQLRRLVISEAPRFPELGKALYEGGPGRAIAGLATALARWSAQGLLAIDDPLVAATQFNWLIMGEPVNRAMFYVDEKPMGAARRKAHIAAGVRVFLAAYRPFFSLSPLGEREKKSRANHPLASRPNLAMLHRGIGGFDGGLALRDLAQCRWHAAFAAPGVACR